MLIHLIGTEPFIDFTSHPKAILLRHAYRNGMPKAVVTRYRHTWNKGSIQELHEPVTASTEAEGYFPTVVQVTRLNVSHNPKETFAVFKAPIFDTLKMESFFWVMITIQTKVHEGAFVTVSKWNESLMYAFLRGEHRPTGGTVLYHPSYTPADDSHIPNERIVAPIVKPAMRRLLDDGSDED